MPRPQGFANRLIALDVLRAVAVIMVVLFHVATRSEIATLDPVAFWFLRYGFLGVDIFFPLSGFLITSFLLDRQGPAAVGEFFVRRLFRIVPLYFAAVTLFAVAALATGVQTELLPRLWVTYSFLTAWFAFAGGPDSVPFTITWSVSVEEFAYIVFGLAALVMRRHFSWLLVALAILPFLLRVWLYARGAADIYYFPLARLDSIAIGGLVALAARHGRLHWGPFAAAAAFFVALRYVDLGPVSQAALFSAVTCLTCTVVALCLRYLADLRGWLWEALARIGLYSYFVYLMHFFAIYALFVVFGRLGIAPGFWVMSALALLVTLAAAHLSFVWFEAPLIRYGRTLGQRIAGRGPVQAQAAG
jgi:peptidoglycan/LPS O-acetylase OafA/YrhL